MISIYYFYRAKTSQNVDKTDVLSPNGTRVILPMCLEKYPLSSPRHEQV